MPSGNAKQVYCGPSTRSRPFDGASVDNNFGALTVQSLFCDCQSIYLSIGNLSVFLSDIRLLRAWTVPRPACLPRENVIVLHGATLCVMLRKDCSEMNRLPVGDRRLRKRTIVSYCATQCVVLWNYCGETNHLRPDRQRRHDQRSSHFRFVLPNRPGGRRRRGRHNPESFVVPGIAIAFPCSGKRDGFLACISHQPSAADMHLHASAGRALSARP